MQTRRPCAVRPIMANSLPTSLTTAPTSAVGPPIFFTCRARSVTWQPRPSCLPSPTTSTCRSASQRGPRSWRADGAASCRSSWGWVRRTAGYCSTSASSSLSSIYSPPLGAAQQLLVLVLTTPPAFFTKSNIILGDGFPRTF